VQLHESICEPLHPAAENFSATIAQPGAILPLVSRFALLIGGALKLGGPVAADASRLKRSTE
jgi:hypothetical protein